MLFRSVSCIYGLGSPGEYFDFMIRLQVGDVIERDEILRKLVHIQYERNDMALDRGRFRVRGDVIEIYPSYDDIGIRIELWGDTIDRLSRFHLVTGEVLTELQEINVAPAKHFVTREDSRLSIVQNIEKELTERLEVLEREGKVLEAARLASRTRYDMEMIRETGVCSGIENYSRIIEERAPGTRPFTLIDYFGKDWLMMIDESHVSIPQVGGMFEGDKSRKTTLVEYGFRLPCAIDNRPMSFDEFEYMYPPSVLFVSATPGDYELRKTGGVVVEQINRPTGLLDPQIEVFPVKGQMDVLIDRMTQVIQKDERVLVTTLTKKMAQDLTDYLTEMNIRARYLHSEIKTLERAQIIRGLRLGEFDVLVGINLLREGLDLPEVSLVAILDADKEGFLRNFRSLIQTMGRASRHLNGTVLLFADVMTESLKKAIAETKRRRQTQEAFNTLHGITPKSVTRRLENQLEMQDPLNSLFGDEKLKEGDSSNLEATPESLASIEELEAQMKAAAALLDFEEAARIRDIIRERSSAEEEKK